MDSKMVSKGIRKYKYDESNATLLTVETFICAVFIGVYFSSWLYFSLSILFFFFAVRYRPLSIFVSVMFSLFWAMIAFVIGMGFIQSLLVAIILAVVVFVISFGLHLSGYEGFET